MKKLLIFVVFALFLAPIIAAQGLPFTQDDYAKSLFQAKQRNVPIFAECWAPW